MRSGEAVWTFCNRGDSVRRSRSDSRLCCIPESQIFFQPSAMSTELAFLTRFLVLKGVFLQRQTLPQQSGGSVQLEAETPRALGLQ